MQVCAGSLFSEQRNALERVLKTIALKSIPVKFVIHFVFIMIMPDNDEMIIVITIPDILRTWNLDQYASAFQSKYENKYHKVYSLIVTVIISDINYMNFSQFILK